MDKLVIEGGRRIVGEIRVDGAKNAALPLLAATLLAPGTHRLENVPDLRDTRTMLRLLASFGVEWEREPGGALLLNSDRVENFEASYDLVKTMRASVLVLGPLLARLGRARVSLPGGCAIGARPIDFHTAGLAALGADFDLDAGYVDGRAARLTGNTVYFDIPSVTGTENILMAAVRARGTTVIKNAAREPEIGNLIDMLTGMGARIKGRGSDILEVEGVDELGPASVRIIPDRIETGTFMLAAAATGGELRINGCSPQHLPALIEKLRRAGVKVDQGDDWILVARDGGDITAVDVKTMPYPGFPTDLQAQFMALMTLARGTSVITETIFENRFMHVAELRRLGADISIDGHSAVVRGRKNLRGANVMATDLRASASLVIAGLVADGVTEISRIYHLDRGYAGLEKKLARAGAVIRRESE